MTRRLLQKVVQCCFRSGLRSVHVHTTMFAGEVTYGPSRTRSTLRPSNTRTMDIPATNNDNDLQRRRRAFLRRKRWLPFSPSSSWDSKSCWQAHVSHATLTAHGGRCWVDLRDCIRSYQPWKPHRDQHSIPRAKNPLEQILIRTRPEHTDLAP